MDKRIKNKLINILFVLYKITKNIFFIREGTCKFVPSCSHYAKEAIINLPLQKALIKIVIRIIKCNPFSRGGYDPLIANEERKRSE
jgi:putative membrane protein insertion efficiency factor